MSGRKRKADDELPDPAFDRMSSSPSPSPAPAPAPGGTSSFLRPSSRHFKRPRTNVGGRPLSLPRLLETMSTDDMRGVLRTICQRHPEIGAEIASTAPRPSINSALSVLETYQATLRQSFPYGDRPTSEYSYNRVRQPLLQLLDALRDYTPAFLPPNESQISISLAFLDGATEVVHQLPDWDSFQHDRHKQEAYEEISRAWALVLREAAKKGGGYQVQYGGWDQKLAKHNELSAGKMQEAMAELHASTGWCGSSAASGGGDPSLEQSSIREQLMSGNYTSAPIQVGRW